MGKTLRSVGAGPCSGRLARATAVLLVLSCLGFAGVGAHTASAASTTTVGSGSLSLGSGSGSEIITPSGTTTTSSTSSSGGSISTLDAVLIGVVAIALMAGITVYMVRDARRRTSRAHHHSAATAAHGRHAGGRVHADGRAHAQKARKLSHAERKRRKRGRSR